MKKSIILFLVFVFSFSFFASADQLQWLSKEQAEQAVQYLHDAKVKHAVLWCACCDNDPAVKIKIKKVEIRYTGTDNYYEVVVTGKLADGTPFSNAVDLAYFHIKSDNQAYCLGYILNFECDPCTGPFEW